MPWPLKKNPDQKWIINVTKKKTNYLRASVAEIQHHNQNLPGEERVYLLLQLSEIMPSPREVKVGTWRQTKQKPQRTTALWFAQPVVLYTPDRLPRVAPSTVPFHINHS